MIQRNDDTMVVVGVQGGTNESELCSLGEGGEVTLQCDERLRALVVNEGVLV